jgi:hypothetical protein
MMSLQSRKLVAFAFWEFRRTLVAISGDWLLDFRAMSLLVITQICLILSVLEFGSIILGRRLIPASMPGATLFALCFAIAIAVLNLYAVSYNNHWKQYEREFEGYSTFIKTLGPCDDRLAGTGWNDRRMVDCVDGSASALDF